MGREALQRRRSRVLAVADADDRFQFGQPLSTHRLIRDDNACGPNAMQIVDHVWSGSDNITMDDIVRAGVPIADRDELVTRGLLFSEMERAAEVLGLPYVGRRDLSAEQVLQIAKHLGPVIFVCKYTYWPEWKGYVYYDVEADAKPNGFARPWGQAGRNQVFGFDGGHYGVVLSSKWRRKPESHTDVWLRDPNHASVVRPEKPHYDIVRGGQFERLYESARLTTLSRQPWALVPTVALGG